MEDALRGGIRIFKKSAKNVLILIVMEDALRGYGYYIVAIFNKS